MKVGRIGRRYARGLLNMYPQEADAKRALDLLDHLVAIFEFEEAAKVLKSPVMPKSVKLAVLDHVLERANAEKGMRDFLKMITHEGRVGFIPEIRMAFVEMLDEMRKVAKVEVVSAVALDDEQKKEISSTLEKMLSQKIELQNRIDPKIIGGLWIQVGNSVVDLSLKSRLQAIASAAAS
jgi:F-type H+-transporting ATPase subunit delta